MIYVRAVYFAAAIMTAGVVFFIAAIAEPAFRDGKNDTRLALTVRVRLAWIAWISLILAVLSGTAWLVLTAQSMSGEALADVFSQGVLWTVLTQTTFGNYWLLRFVVACALAGVFVPFLRAQNLKPNWLKATAIILAAAFVGSLAWAGHAIGGQGVEGILHPSADVLHLIAAAAWAGALVPLALLLAMAGRDTLAVARTATLRFSKLGIVSVGTLLATGIVNTWYLAGSIPALLETDYGRLLLIKIVLFLGMVGIAAVNRLRLTARIVNDANLAGAQQAVRQLRRNAAIEASIGAVIIGIVAVLGTLPPASHAHHHASSGGIPADATFQHIHSKQGMADVTIEPGRVGTARATIRLSSDHFETLEARELTLTLTAPTVGSKPTTRAASQDSEGAWRVDGIRLSEPGNWTVAVDAVLATGRRLELEAPIVIEPSER
jgi:putative copper resistance protein D